MLEWLGAVHAGPEEEPGAVPSGCAAEEVRLLRGWSWHSSHGREGLSSPGGGVSPLQCSRKRCESSGWLILP